MLILTRKIGESIVIDNDIVITLLEQRGSQVRVGVKAPKDIKIFREEVYLQILEQNKLAAQEAEEIGLEDLSDFVGGFKLKKPGTTKAFAGKVKIKTPSNKEDKK